MLGYPCMNRTLRDREEPLRCNRGMQKATFEERGPAYAAELARKNMRDLRTILEWNRGHGIGFYRVTSTLVPWNSQFELADLDARRALWCVRSRARDAAHLPPRLLVSAGEHLP